MKHEFRLADIGEGLEEAEIVAWRVQVGDTVERDAALVEVMTDKSNADLPAPWSGTIVSLGGAVGDLIQVGEVVAVIDDGVGPSDSEPFATGAFESAVQPPAPTPSFFADTASSPSAKAVPGESSAEPAQSAVPPPSEAQPSSPVAIPLATDVSASAATGSDATGSDQPAPPPMPRRAKASPTTRREAVRRGIDIATITGSGPGGRVLLSDLDNPAASHVAPPQPAAQPAAVAAQPKAPSVAPSSPALHAQPKATPVTPPQHAAAQSAQREPGVEPLRGIRRLIARNMTASWQQVPHIHAWREIDAEPLVDLRARLRDSGRDHYARLTPLSFFVSAVAQALRTYPVANSSLDMSAETITTHAHVNIGIAVASPQGLVVPVIRDADQLSLSETAMQIATLVDRARLGELGAEAFRGGTATITNFGSLGGENATPILRPPESVIVGFGSIAPRPFVVDGHVVARQTMNVVIAADHRLLDGDVTTAFLNHVCERLIDPVDLALGL